MASALRNLLREDSDVRVTRAIVVLATALTAACGGRTGTAGQQVAATDTLQEYQAIEIDIGPRYSAAQERVSAGQLDAVAKEAQALAVSFGESERFWAQNKRADAVKWASEGRMLATGVAGAAAAGDATKAREGMATIERSCTQCHAAYREADPAGGFRVREVAGAR